MIHGGGSKPNEAELRALWVQALRTGLERDAPEKLPAFDNADIHMVYFAHHLQDFTDGSYDEALDVDNRRQNLQQLAAKTKEL